MHKITKRGAFEGKEVVIFPLCLNESRECCRNTCVDTTNHLTFNIPTPHVVEMKPALGGTLCSSFIIYHI